MCTGSAQEEQEKKELRKNAQIHSIRNQSIETQTEEALKDSETNKNLKKKKQQNVLTNSVDDNKENEAKKKSKPKPDENLQDPNETTLKPIREPKIHSIRKTKRSSKSHEIGRLATIVSNDD